MPLFKFYYLSGNDGVIFYVGKTTGKLKFRLSVHKAEAKCGGFNSDKDDCVLFHWDDVKINSIENIWCSKEMSRSIEVYWIQQFQVWGFKLCNRDGAIKKKMDKKPAIPKKPIQIEIDVYNEFNSFCKKRGMVVCRVAQMALKEKMEAIKDREQELKIA